MNTSFIWN